MNEWKIEEQKYIGRLKMGITHLPESVKDEIIEDIRLHFAEGRDRGDDLVEFVARLGKPEDLTEEYHEMYGNTVEKEPKKKRSILGKIMSGIGMTIFNLVLPLPIISILAVLWVLLASGIVLSVLSIFIMIVVLINAVIPIPNIIVGYPLSAFFGCISLIALGLLMFMGAMESRRIFKNLAIRYFNWNIRMITGGNR